MESSPPLPQIPGASQDRPRYKVTAVSYRLKYDVNVNKQHTCDQPHNNNNYQEIKTGNKAVYTLYKWLCISIFYESERALHDKRPRSL